MYWFLLFCIFFGENLSTLSAATCPDSAHPLLESVCISGTGTARNVYCYLKTTYTQGKPVYERGATNETVCRSMADQSTLKNHKCQEPNPPSGTICFDCCQTYFCYSLDSYKCNKGDSIDERFMPNFMKQGSSPSHTSTPPITSKPTPSTAPTTTPSTTVQTTTSTTTVPTTTTIPTTTATLTTKTLTTQVIPTTILTTIATTQASTTQTTTVPTTTIQTTTPFVSGITCLNCVEDTQHQCNVSDYVTCHGDRPYCLNEVIYSGGNWSRTFHRCASRVECYWDYWIRTGNGTGCIQDGLCTYCCDDNSTLPCNQEKIKPNKLVTFDQKKATVHKCRVTDFVNGGETEQDCTDKEGTFCLNKIVYDTQTNTITGISKQCATKDYCKSHWLQTRKQNECLTGNVTGVNAAQSNNQVLCYYCCESNSTTPCNLKPKPDQINLFIQPTVTTTLATTTTSTTQSTTPTTTPTTTSTTTPTTTTPTTPPTTTTTATTTTTPPPSKIKCQQCGDPAFGIPCSYQETHSTSSAVITDCPGQYSFCMTDILHDSRGNVDIFKRCVDDSICAKEWIKESADQDYCKRYGIVNYNGAFSCHFCCTTAGCNVGVVPNATTWYTKP